MRRALEAAAPFMEGEAQEEIKRLRDRVPFRFWDKRYRDIPHKHRNPSPSLAVAAWCNGTPEDPGCGGPLPVYDFVEGERWEGWQCYFVDGRVGLPDGTHTLIDAGDYRREWIARRDAEVKAATLSARVEAVRELATKLAGSPSWRSERSLGRSILAALGSTETREGDDGNC
jgi:hypothetical protein